MPFFSPKTTVFIKFVVSLTIVNDDPSLSIVNIIVNRKFVQKQSFKKRSQIVLIKTIVIRFLKAQNESFFSENETIVLENKTKNDHLQKRLRTLTVLM